MANPSPSQLQPVNENLFSLCLMIENEIVSARYFKMLLILRFNLRHYTVWPTSRMMRWERRMAVCHKQPSWRPEELIPQRRWVDENVSCHLFALFLISTFVLSTYSMLRHFASQWEYIMSRSQHVLSHLKEQYLQAAFILFPHIWFIGNWSLSVKLTLLILFTSWRRLSRSFRESRGAW